MLASNYDDVCRQLADAGLILPADGLRIGTHRPVRVLVEDGGREKRGWYWLREWSPSADKLLIVGSFGTWSGTDNGAQKIALPNDESGRMTPDQRDAMRRVWAEAAKAAELQRQKEIAAAAERARRAWPKLEREGDSPYLKSKGVKPDDDLRFTASGTAVVPVRDIAGVIHGLQFLRTPAQAKESKRPRKEFWPAGLAKKGNFHLLGPTPTWVVLVAEGYATAVSLHMATDLPVVCAFDAGNLLPVVTALHKRYRKVKILICADDDSFTEGNPGVTAASTAALAVNGAWVRPVFTDEVERQQRYTEKGTKLTDFNDLHAIEGLGVVGAQIETRLSELGWSAPPQRVPSSTPGGRGAKLKVLQTLDDVLGRFSTVHGSAGGVFDRQEHELMVEKDVRNICVRADLFRAWMDHPERDVIRKTDVIFDPANTDPAAYNLWSGWPTEPVPGKCTLLLELLEYMCSGENNSRDLYQWVLRWIALPIQQPGAKMKSTVVVHGPQGAGKNLFFEAVMGIYGKYGRVLNQDALDDKHNDWASRKLFLIADEVVAQAHRYEIKNKLKTLITGDWIRINPKHIGAYDEANHLNLVFLSNETLPVVLEEDDRRHCVIWTPAEKPADFYAAVYEEVRNGGIAALHDYLLHLDLGDFHVASRPPMTDAKQRLIGMAQDSPVEFVDSLYRLEMQPLKPMPGLTTDWYHVYRHWCGLVGVKPASLKRFVDGIDRRRHFPTRRKGYLQGQTITYPKSMILWGQAPPEGTVESTWLGDQIPAMRSRMQDFLSGNSHEVFP